MQQDEPYSQFSSAIHRAECVADHARDVDNAEVADDILRGAFASAISAMDSYFHSIIRVRLLYSYALGEKPSASFDAFNVPLGLVQDAYVRPGGQAMYLSWLDYEIERQLGFQSFQAPKKIADGVRLISATPFWPEMHVRLNNYAEWKRGSIAETQGMLALFVDRRNQIVHQADSKRNSLGAVQLNEIDLIEVQRCIRLVRDLVGEADRFLRKLS